jgi:hypothetical protein
MSQTAPSHSRRRKAQIAAILGAAANSTRVDAVRPSPRVADGIASFVQENDCLGLPLIGGPVSLASVWRAGA